MKSIMAKESSSVDQGVPSFEYCPADIKQPLLFELTRPLDELGDMLLEEYAGEKIGMKELYEKHSVGKRYIIRNYKDILIQLETAKKIKARPPSSKRRKNTFSDNLIIYFPKKG